MIKFKDNYLKVLLALFAMVLLTYIGTTIFRVARIDFTEEGLYTLSEGTERILQKLDAPIKLKLYYSKTAANKGTEGLRAFNNYHTYVKELLRQYVSNTRNNLTLELIDPRPDTIEEESAIAYGLKKFNLTETERYFFGLVAENESGTEKIIEFFDPDRKDKLEYEITKLIYTVLKPQKKNIGIISSLKVLAEDTNPYMAQMLRMQGKQVQDSWVVTKMLKEFYNVKKISKETDLISGIDTLIIIHPKDFPEKTLLAIDQYLLKGGNLLVFVDPNAVSDRSGGIGGMVSSSPDAGFRKLMDRWGIELKPNSYAGDKYLSGIGSFNRNQPAGRLLPLLSCDINCTKNYNDTVVSGINRSTFIFPGVLNKKKVEGVEQIPIMSTTDKGNSYTAAGYELGNPRLLWDRFQEGDEPVVIAYKVVGKFKTAFPNGIEKIKKNGDKRKVKKEIAKESLLKTSKKDAAIIVFSDVDFITDQFAFKRTFLGLAVANDNNTLFLNSAEALSGDVNLISVRSKSRIDRSFNVINEIEFEAERKTKDKVAQINGNIMRFQTELNQLGKKANEGNIAILQNQGIKKKKELAKKIAVLKHELRAVKREGREKIESIGKILQYINTLAIPLFITAFGMFYNRKRSNLMKGKRQREDVASSLDKEEKLEEVKV